MRFWSMDSMPCIGAFTCAANCDSKCFIRPSNASRCSDATTSFGFCVLIHCSENLLHVAQGVSPSQRIFRRRQRSQALDTDLRLGCHSLTAPGEKVAGPSPSGSDVKGHMLGLGGLGFRAGSWRLRVSALKDVDNERATIERRRRK